METDNQLTVFTAKTISGLENVLAGELIALGAKQVEPGRRAVTFSGDQTLLYKVNYLSRTALRILKPIYQFEANNEKQLYDAIHSIKWYKILGVDDTFVIDSNVHHSKVFTHSHYVSQRCKDAIADQFRSMFNRRPSIDTEDPKFRIDVHIVNSQCTVSLDSSGASLHKRGYRKAGWEAPLSEVLAAGLILLSGWDKTSNFADPMCGSGTLLTEAAMIAMNIPAGYYRKHYSFMHWFDFEPRLWKDIVSQSMNEQKEFEGEIWGSDISPKAIRICEQNLSEAKLHKDISISVKSLHQFVPPAGKGIIITNPPYGERIKPDDILQLYRDLGDMLKNRALGYTAWVISGDSQAIKHIGLKPSEKHVVFNGNLECRFHRFDIFQGTYKENKASKSI